MVRRDRGSGLELRKDDSDTGKQSLDDCSRFGATAGADSELKAGSQIPEDIWECLEQPRGATQDLSPYVDSETPSAYDSQARPNDLPKFVVAPLTSEESRGEYACGMWTPSAQSSSRYIDEKTRLPNRERDEITDDDEESDEAATGVKWKSAISRSAVVLADKGERNEVLVGVNGLAGAQPRRKTFRAMTLLHEMPERVPGASENGVKGRGTGLVRPIAHSRTGIAVPAISRAKPELATPSPFQNHTAKHAAQQRMSIQACIPYCDFAPPSTQKARARASGDTKCVVAVGRVAVCDMAAIHGVLVEICGR
uniref:Uncharacterized protein n=1 Tax=Mycena chlorophos TaxID=658473 RepID=A0ABQ0KZ82_MYCCL|nr:predicted protein [Mycena chlorophos]